MDTEHLRPVHASYACIPNCAVGHREYPGRYPARACTAPSFYSWPLGLAPRQTPTRGPGPAVSGSTDNTLVDGHCRVAPRDELRVAEGIVRLLGRHATLVVLLLLAPQSFERARRRALDGHSARHRCEARLAQVARGLLAWLARLAGVVTVFAGA